MRKSRLSSARPGTSAGPFAPPASAPARVRRIEAGELRRGAVAVPAGPLHDGADVVLERDGRRLGPAAAAASIAVAATVRDGRN